MENNKHETLPNTSSSTTSNDTTTLYVGNDSTHSSVSRSNTARTPKLQAIAGRSDDFHLTTNRHSLFRTRTTTAMEKYPVLKQLIEYLPLEATLHKPTYHEDEEESQNVDNFIAGATYQDIYNNELDYLSFLQKALLHAEIFGACYLVKTDGRALTEELADNMYSGVHLVGYLQLPSKQLDSNNSTPMHLAIEPFCYKLLGGDDQSDLHIHPSRVYKLRASTLVDAIDCRYDNLSHYVHPFVYHWDCLQDIEATFNKDFKHNVLINHEITGMSKAMGRGAKARMAQALKELDTAGLFLTDKDTENIQYISRNLNNHVEIRDAAIERFAMIVGFPKEYVTGIMSSSGLGGSAQDGVRRHLADKVSAYQTRQLTPVLDWLLVGLSDAVGIDITVTHPSTIQKTHIEEMTERKMALEIRKMELEIQSLESQAPPTNAERRFVQ